MRLRVAACALAWAAVTTSCAAQSAGEAAMGFDLFAFSQSDDGGHPFRAEGFGYGGARLETALPLSRITTWQTTWTVALIANEDQQELPPSVGNANVTSASADVLTLDASSTFHIRRPGSAWTWLPGLYYHHQFGYIAGGFDLGIRREVASGDATILFDYSFRYAYPLLTYWNFVVRGHDSVYTSNIRIGWTQTLSPALVVSTSAQLTRQDGFLSDPYSFVAVTFDGAPIGLVDEVLPRSRTRTQLNVRLRYSPSIGLSFGIDASGYRDDWDIRHGSIEPGITVPFGAARTRAWVRVVRQRGSKFQHDAEGFPETLRTQDADLGSFRTLAAGSSVSFPIGDDRGPTWRYRIALFGFTRDDEIDGVGLDTGLRITW